MKYEIADDYLMISNDCDKYIFVTNKHYIWGIYDYDQNGNKIYYEDSGGVKYYYKNKNK